MQYYPAYRCVLIDDKLRILSAVKEIWKDRVTTVFVKMGHYARETEGSSVYLKADVDIKQIEDLVSCNCVPFSKAVLTLW